MMASKNPLVLRETELRKLSYNQMHMVASQLNDNRSWRELMMAIPKHLDGVETAMRKYTRDHIRMVENASGTKLAGHILFEEWGTSGRERPTVGHLLDLLTKTSLYRAADYVAIHILQEPPPKRPTSGPAASIDVALPPPGDELTNNLDLSTNGFESPSSTRNIPIQSDFFGNEGIVVSNEPSNSGAATISTELRSSETIEGISDIEIPTLNSVSESIQSSETSSEDGAILSTVMSTQNEPSDEVSIVDIPNISLLQLNNHPVEQSFQSDLPNISFLAGNFAAVSPSSTSSSSAAYTTSTSSANSDSFRSSLMNTSLPQLSFLQNQFHSPEITPENTFPIKIDSNVAKFQMEDLKRTTNGFNESDFGGVELPGRKIGSGGFGTVYLAVDLSPSFHLAAVKRLHKNHDNQDVTKKFAIEIQILSKHAHPNLVRLLGCSAEDAFDLCLVYEYISGGNLERKLELCRRSEILLPWKKRAFIALGVARAIDYLHQNNLIHRDIKSANVLLDDADIPKLCDFGLLRALNSRTTTMVVGSSGYMAPETVRGTFDEKVDIFAFGVVQLELLTGLSVIERTRSEDLVSLVKRVAEDSAGDVTSLLDRKANQFDGDNWSDFGQEWFDRVTDKSLEYESRKRSKISACLHQLELLCNKI